MQDGDDAKGQLHGKEHLKGRSLLTRTIVLEAQQQVRLHPYCASF